MSTPRPTRQGILAALHRSGTVIDESGRATYVLARAIGYEARPVSLSPLLASLERDGLVTREVRGRRCYSIELTDKGRAMVDLDVGFRARATDMSSDASGADRAPVAPRWANPAGREPSRWGAERASDVLRLELRDIWMELGAHRQRLAELERQLGRAAGHASSGAPGIVDEPASGEHHQAG